MPDYPRYDKYAATAGVTRREIIDALREYFPRYSKASHSMVCRPESYGVMLLPEAEAVLVDKYGEVPGLSGLLGKIPVEQPKPRRRERRSKPNKLTVRLGHELFSRLKGYYGKTAFASMQDMVEAAISEFLERRGE